MPIDLILSNQIQIWQLFMGMQKVQQKVSDLLTQTFSTFILLIVLALIPDIRVKSCIFLETVIEVMDLWIPLHHPFSSYFAVLHFLIIFFSFSSIGQEIHKGTLKSSLFWVLSHLLWFLSSWLKNLTICAKWRMCYGLFYYFSHEPFQHIFHILMFAFFNCSCFFSLYPSC